jgi:hypothetical protein
MMKDEVELITCSANSPCRESKILQRTLHTITEPIPRESPTISVAFSINGKRQRGSRLPDKLYTKMKWVCILIVQVI